VQPVADSCSGVASSRVVFGWPGGRVATDVEAVTA
jgi:hypothetical protein